MEDVWMGTSRQHVGTACWYSTLVRACGYENAGVVRKSRYACMLVWVC